MNTTSPVAVQDARQGALPQVVIVGAGFGGLRVAQALRDAPVQITVIDRNNAHVFQPLLYQVATADLSPADISAPIRSILSRQRNAQVVLAEVTSVDLANRRVLARDRITGARTFEVPYDYLVLATGAGPSYFGHDDWEQAAPGLKSLADATAIRRRILLAFEAAEAEPAPERRQALLTFVLVGGGPTGVEMAGAIADLARRGLKHDFRVINPAQARILLVEAAPSILGSFPAPLARHAREALQRAGVEVLEHEGVEQVDDAGVVVGGKRIAAGTVIWAAGVTASPAGRWLGAPMDRAGRVLVQSDLSVPGHPEIFVLGDTAHMEQDGKPLPGVAPVAMQQGRYVGRLIRARLAGRQLAPFRYHNKGNLATIGRVSAIADLDWFRPHGVQLHGFIGWLVWVVVHIFYLIGFRNRLLVMTQWAWAYLTAQRGARLITLDTPQTQAAPSETRQPAGAR